jgi:hypothetical protein
MFSGDTKTADFSLFQDRLQINLIIPYYPLFISFMKLRVENSVLLNLINLWGVIEA